MSRDTHTYSHQAVSLQKNMQYDGKRGFENPMELMHALVALWRGCQMSEIKTGLQPFPIIETNEA